MTDKESSDEKTEIAAEGNIITGSMNIVEGDFIGRDKGVFLGRDIPSQQVINIAGINNSNITIYPDTTIGRIGSQIDRLRGRVTRLIPVEDALIRLVQLREPKPIGGLNIEEIGLSLFGVSANLRAAKVSKEESTVAQKYLAGLSDIEAAIVPNIETERYSQLLQSLSNIADDINIRISQLSSLFTSIVYPATTSKEVANNLVTKIGHKEFRDEAKMHLGVIAQLVEKLDSETLTRPDFDVLSDEAIGAIGLMTELEKRRILIEGLIKGDRSRRNWTVTSVIIYICVSIAIIIYLIIQWGSQFAVGQVPLVQLKIPVLGIPYPVIIWSLIGSFASMIYRFNAKPIYDFTDAIKWMITRPVQGVVLGSVLYLILISGLFILTAGKTDNPAGLISTDEVILVLCFLIGFSDRFADNVFNTLVQRYSVSNDRQENGKKESENENAG
jgi:hypothetical protein